MELEPSKQSPRNFTSYFLEKYMPTLSIANYAISLLYQFLWGELKKAERPPDLWLNLDNCAKDNKNMYHFFFD